MPQLEIAEKKNIATHTVDHLESVDATIGEGAIPVLSRSIVLCHNPGVSPPVRARSFPRIAAFIAVALFAGCTTLETSRTACLQQAMAANHKATMSLFRRANEEMQPCRIEQAVDGTAFSRDTLSFLAPSDLAEWDNVLDGLDAYCAALADLASGRNSADVTAESKSLGLKIQSLVKSVRGSGAGTVGAAGTAVSELGGILVNYRAGGEVRTVAKAADPGFQLVIGSLVGALGFAGHPPAPVSHGLLAACEAGYGTMYAEKIAGRFKGDAIAGFEAMSPAARRAAIKDFVAWLGVEQDHEELVGSVTALAAALDKAAAAHAALANGSEETVGAAFADLRAELQNTIRISQKLKGE
jgi:hypothetical protein